MTEQELSNYDAGFMPIMDLLWGKGFIAPGGEGNVDRIVAGIDLDGKRVIASGLAAGDQVILDGLMKVHPGMPVTPQPAGIAASDASSGG